MENLTDRQAADAVRSRLDWKYALSLEILDPGFDHTVLSEFRTRLVALTAEERLLEAVVALCKPQGWLREHGQQRAITSDPASQWMLTIPAVDTLQRIWKQDYLPQEKGGTWIADQDRLEAARLFFSPYDLDASAAKKRST